jgi:hypothetical protein
MAFLGASLFFTEQRGPDRVERSKADNVLENPMRRTFICAVAAAIIVGAAGYAVAQDKQPSSSQQQVQKGSDPPPSDAQTPDKRGERAQTPAPGSEDQGRSRRRNSRYRHQRADSRTARPALDVMVSLAGAF